MIRLVQAVALMTGIWVVAFCGAGSSAIAQDSIPGIFHRDTIRIGNDTAFFALNDTMTTADTMSMPDRMRILFSGLDTTTMGASILLDKALLPWRGLTRFNGTSDTSAPDAVGWLQLHRMLLFGQMYTARAPLVFDSLNTRCAAALGLGRVPIAIMNIHANSIKDSAFSDSLLGMSQDGQKIIDLTGEQSDSTPYLRHRVFLTAAASSELPMDTVRFVIDTTAYYVSNAYDSIRSIKIDFDDGAGYRTISSGVVVPIWYSTAGTRTARVRIAIGRTTVDTLRSSFEVEIQASTGGRTSPMPSSQNVDSVSITATLGYPNASNLASGKMHIYLACDRTTIQKPFIYVEGIDVLDTQYPDDYIGTHRAQFFQKLRDNGYDVIIVNFDNGADYVQRSAFFLEAVIAEVNARTQSDEKIVLMGESMGGLVARYALADMEGRSIDHNTRLFISFDSPQRGAMIPAGALWFARVAENLFGRTLMAARVWLTTIAGLAGGWAGGFAGTATTEWVIGVTGFMGAAVLEEKLDRMRPSRLFVDRPGINQMLYYTSTEEMVLKWIQDPTGWGGYQQYVRMFGIEEHASHRSLYNELTALGYPNPLRLPDGVRKVAITNGDIHGATQDSNSFVSPDRLNGPSLAGHERMVRAEVGSSAFSLHMDAEAWASPTASQGIQTVLRVDFTSLLLAHFNRAFQFGSKICYESLPGGYFAVDPKLIPHPDSLAWYVPIPRATFDRPAFCFIPTVSSLDIDRADWGTGRVVGSTDETIATYLATYPTQTPFDAFYADTLGGNQPHTYLPEGGSLYAAIFEQEILSNEVNVFIQNRTLYDTRVYKSHDSITAGSKAYPAGYRHRPKPPTQGPVVITAAANVEFLAGREVIMKDGFEVQPGALFRAAIDPTFTGACVVLNPSTAGGTPAGKRQAPPAAEPVTGPVGAASLSMSAWPNPASSSITVEWLPTAGEDFTIEIVDARGRIVGTTTGLSQVGRTNTFQIDVSALTSGYYLVRLTAGDATVSRSIVVAR